MHPLTRTVSSNRSVGPFYWAYYQFLPATAVGFDISPANVCHYHAHALEVLAQTFMKLESFLQTGIDFDWHAYDASLNIGIQTGQVSNGLVVIDLDREPPGLRLPSTPIASTGRGRHVYL